MSFVEFERVGPVAVVTLERPDRMNALGAEMLLQLQAAYEQIDRDSAVRVGILTGRGRAFCAGRDMKEANTAETDLSEQATTKMHTLFMENHSSKPLVSAVNGYAGGAGFYLATRAVDFVVAAESARFQIAEVPRGILHGWQTGHWFNLSRAASLELAFGFAMNGARAHAVGLANDVTPDDRLMEVAMARADYIAQMPADLIAANRALRARVENTVPAEVDDDGNRMYRELMASGVAAEGDRAFLEKRAVKPND